MAASVRSVSTIGGIPFDELCRGEISNYSFNLVDLVEDEDSEEKGKMDRDVEKLSKKLKDTIQSLEIVSIDHKGSAIQYYYIGKTYICRRKKGGCGGFQTFNHMNENTWVKKGISGRYQKHSKEIYGHDGLVVLAAITRCALPRDHLERISQEDYALILEQRLTHHLLINERDDRVYNATFSEGRRQRKPQGIDRNTDKDSNEKGAYAYAIYMAFKREKSCKESDECTEEDKLTSPPVKKKPKLQQEGKP